jgi:hypothetical protein
MFGNIGKLLGKLDPVSILDLAISQVPNGKGKQLADAALNTVKGGASPAGFMDALENGASLLEGIVPNAGERLNFLKDHAFWKELRKRSGSKEEIESYGTGLLKHLDLLKK